MDKLKDFLKTLKEKSGQTAERPRYLETDALARYSFAKRYCKGKKVLDVGTGFGLGAELVAKSGAKSVLGIDYNLNVISKIQRENRTRNLDFLPLDVFQLDKINKKFDIVLAFEVIEHLPVSMVNEFIAILYEHLLPGGILLLSTPNGLKSEYLFGSLYNPYHVKEYKREEIKAFLSKYFSRLDIKGYKMVNKVYSKRSTEISRTMVHKISYVLGHFKFIRELLAFIPIKVKQVVTKESSLPNLTEKDYVLVSNVKDCYGLFAIAKKDEKQKKKLFKVSIVIANYNGENYLRSCLDSVLKSSYRDFELIVCDDGSTDGSLDILTKYKKRDHRLILVRNRENLGASASRNKAVKKASGEIIVFLDNDTIVEKKWLSFIINPFLGDIRVGASQALLLDLKSKILIQHAGGLLVPQVGWLIPFLQWKKYSATKNEISQRDIIAVSAALAVRRDVFFLAGGFDEMEAVHTEDLDLCWRIWISGYKIVLADKAIVYHLSKSVAKRSHMGSSNFRIYFHMAKNSFRSLIKNYELANVLKFLPQSIFINLSRGILVLIKRGDTSALFATISAMCWNVVHVSDTMSTRNLVQANRLLPDKYIMERVFDKRGLIEIYEKDFKQTRLLW